jgi:hypothetical protein
VEKLTECQAPGLELVKRQPSAAPLEGLQLHPLCHCCSRDGPPFKEKGGRRDRPVHAWPLPIAASSTIGSTSVTLNRLVTQCTRLRRRTFLIARIPPA